MPQAFSYTLPAPFKGLNSRDPIDQMEESYALELENMLPDGTDVETRLGYTTFSQSLVSAVWSLFEFCDTDGTRKLIGAANNGFYDITAGGSCTALSVTGVTNNLWQTHGFNGKVIACNGVDRPRQFDIWTSLGVCEANYTGITDHTTLIQGCAYRKRQYFIQKGTQSVWWGDVNAVTGILTELPLGSYLGRGGKLLWVNSLTNATGTLLEDMLVVCAENGEILTFTGDYPGNEWSLVARYVVGRPVGQRSWIRVPGDLWVITESGVISLKELLGGATITEAAVSDVIYKTWKDNYKLYYSNTGWCGVNHEATNYVLINLPVTLATTAGTQVSYQYIVNLKTGAWAKFSGQNAICWCSSGGALYFGGDNGQVYRADYGDDDNGKFMRVNLRQAYNYFGDRANEKHFLEGRCFLKSTGNASVGINMDTDFRNAPIADYTQISGTSAFPSWGAAWGTAWGTETDFHLQNVTLAANGFCGGLKIYGDVKDTALTIGATQIRYNKGGQL